jgi:hypothetical protein
MPFTDLHSCVLDCKPAGQMVTYLPIYCASCKRASLSPMSDEGSEPSLCSFCEVAARIVPGPLYSDGDWLTFAQIDQALAGAELLGVQAGELADELQRWMDSPEEPLAIVQHMLRRLPSLMSARLALVSEPPRGLNILLSLLTVRTGDRWLKSGEYPATLLGPSAHPHKLAGKTNRS